METPLMPPALETISQGIPVEIGKIDRELAKLWQQEEGVATRASLMNLAIYGEGPNALAENTKLIARITEDLACRAIVIAIEPDSTTNKVEAWISAHCHMSRTGAKQICCEQISFLLQGKTKNLVSNIVFSHLDSDLPLLLWWQGEFPDPVDEQLWTWVDRLIFDSHAWKSFRQQFGLLRRSVENNHERTVLCDLNWTRSLHYRQTFAQIFDHHENLPSLNEIEEISITHHADFRSTAALVAGWFAAQLGWKFKTAKKDRLEFTTQDPKRTALVSFAPDGEFPLGCCTVKAAKAVFQVCHVPGSDFLHADVRLANGMKYHQLLPTVKEDNASLFNDELMRGGKHRIYLKSLAAAENFLD